MSVQIRPMAPETHFRDGILPLKRKNLLHLSASHYGEVAEWFKALAWKASSRRKPARGFEFHLLRQRDFPVEETPDITAEGRRREPFSLPRMQAKQAERVSSSLTAG